MSGPTLIEALDALLDEAPSWLPPDAEPALAAARARLREPLRVAVAGRVKAGKSTLVNALLGERLAATDVGERTLVVTWYRHGDHPEVVGHGVRGDGGDEALPFRREAGVLDIDLGDREPASVGSIEVRWPNPLLRRCVLIDTPGLGSATNDAGDRTRGLLGLDEGREREADAVVYLLRHRHVEDATLLEAFHDDQLGPATPVNAVAVLSRADEIGGGDLDAMAVARRVADRYAAAPELRRLCHVVVPVCGLLAEGAATLTEPEARALVALAEANAGELALALRSVDDLRDERRRLPLAPEERDALLGRLGLFGVREACRAVAEGARDGAALAEALRLRSGIDDLGQVLARELEPRADLLKAANVLRSLRVLADRHHAEPLAAAVERIESSHHDWAELEALLAVRSGVPGLKPADADEADRLLGGSGSTPAERAGLDASASLDELQAAFVDAVGRWRRRAEHPLATPALVAVAATVIRSAEGQLPA